MKMKSVMCSKMNWSVITYEGVQWQHVKSIQINKGVLRNTNEVSTSDPCEVDKHFIYSIFKIR